MSGNRFEFLEIGEDGTPRRPGRAEGEPDVLPVGSEPFGPRDSDGAPLSQVRGADLRREGPLREERQTARAAFTRLQVAEVFGGQGTGLGQFNAPTGVAVDAGGVLFVADSYNHRVQRITPDGGASLLGGRGGGRGQFLSPYGVATDAASAFYIVEQGNSRVQKFSAHGVLQLVFGRAGAGAGEMRGPTAVAVASGTGDIYVADTGNRRVQRFDCEGNFLGTVGGARGASRPLVSPQALAVDDQDNLYIADTFAHRVLAYDPLGRLRADFRPSGLREPRGLACDMAGLLYVADTLPETGTPAPPQGRLQALDARTGALRLTVAPPTGAGPLARPGGLAVACPPEAVWDAGSTCLGLYVADTLNHRVLRYVWS